MSGEGFRWDPVCDVEKMRTNQAFLNEYVDNLSRIGSLIQFTEQRQTHLAVLETALSGRIKLTSMADKGDWNPFAPGNVLTMSPVRTHELNGGSRARLAPTSAVRLASL